MSSLPNSMPLDRRVRRRLSEKGVAQPPPDAIRVALQVANGDVDEAVTVLVQQQQPQLLPPPALPPPPPPPLPPPLSPAPPSADGNVRRKRRVGQENEDHQLAHRLTAQDEDAAADAAPAMLAALVCESLREAPGLPRGAVVNYDLTVAFLERHAAELGGTASCRESGLYSN